MDTGADPCVDFARYACGNFNKLYPIPADDFASLPSAAASAEIHRVLAGILQNDASGRSHTPEEKLLRDYYTACMDVDSLDERGLTALQPLLTAIDGMSDKKQLPVVLAQLQMVEGHAFFRLYALADDKHADQTIAVLDQAGLGLQSRESYTAMGAKTMALREQYANHIAALLTLSGARTQDNHAVASRIVALESQLAEGFLPPAIHRNPAARYNLLTLDALEQLAPSFDWKVFFAAVGLERPLTINVWSSGYMERVGEVINSSDIDLLRAFLRWRLLSAIPGVDLPSALDKEKFSFEGTVIQGRTQLPSRDRRCQSSITSDVPGPVATAVIHQIFTKDEIQSITAIAQDVEAALSQDIDGLSWMGPSTKLGAQRKVSAITNNVARLDPWNGWGTLAVTANDALTNYLRADRIQTKRTFERIGKPADKSELTMSPIYSGAYWTNSRLSMNVNAGSMLPPFYDASATSATNFGHIGGVIGHEVTHGLDNSGALYDATGSMNNWWSAEDKRHFDDKASCFVEEYSAFHVGDVHVNGELTLGENIADNGGLRIAYLAMLQDAARKHVALTRKRSGLTPEQEFFVAFGQEYCGAMRPEHEKVLMQTDPHTLDQFRVTGSVRNMPEFGHAFSCSVGQPMMPVRSCQIW